MIDLPLLGDFVVLVSTNFRAAYHSDIFMIWLNLNKVKLSSISFSPGASNLFRLILIQMPCPSLTSTAP